MSERSGGSLPIDRFKFQTLPVGSPWAVRVSHLIAVAFKVTSPDVEGENVGCR